MTWSIIAHDVKTGMVGLAVSTCAFAVGARVPSIETGVGVVASQSFVNPFYGPQALALLKQGASAQEAVDAITRADEGRSQRQVHIMDNQFRFAAFTGDGCVDWCGHLIRDTYSVAGNMLAGPQVIETTADFYAAHPELPFAQRLLSALKAGEDAGGDKRGKQSAALLIHDQEDYAYLDIRVDDHADPLAELMRVEEKSRGRYMHYRKFMPSKASPFGIIDRQELESLIAASMAAEAKQ
ncbi:MAG: DUF1028 domain-containing protein [Hyphomicrobiales bacterium]|jgi:uncharacterized Ntn-hydrolase superfamily protein|nr:DUF1028 domain-containing protein [Hyphomicrobiales bacterium]